MSQRWVILLCLLLGTLAGRAQGMIPLDDDALSSVTGQDGVVLAGKFVFNGGSAGPGGMQISFGQTMNGNTNYLVFNGMGGTITMYATAFDQATMPNGQTYNSIELPGYLNFSNYGFTSVSVQADPAAAVSNSYGSLIVNGTLSMTGSIRWWSH